MKNISFELRRNLFHLIFGCLLSLIVFFGDQKFLVPFFSGLVVSGVVISKAIEKRPVPILSWFVEKFGRKDEPPGRGAINFLTGVLISLLFFDPKIVFIGILVLSFDDSFSTIIGISFGKHKIRNNKTLEGFLGGFAAALFVSCMFIPLTKSILVSLVAAVIELYAFLDDNLLIPISACIVISLT